MVRKATHPMGRKALRADRKEKSMGRKDVLPLKIARVNLWSGAIFWGKNIYYLNLILNNQIRKNSVFYLAIF